MNRIAAPPRRLIGIAALAAVLALPLAGCIPITINESSVFFPPQREGAKATDPVTLTDKWLAHANATNFATPQTVSRPAPDTVRIAPVDASARFIGMDARHFLAGPEGQRIAFTLSVPVAGAAGADKVVSGAVRPLIVTCGGNATDRYNAGVSYAQKALRWGDVLHFDYPGYGDSQGTPSAEGFESGTDVVRAEVARVAAGRPVIYWGHSLGGFVCTDLATGTPGLAGIIIETSARNATEVARSWTPFWARPIARVRVAESLAGYDNAATAAVTGVPVLVLGAGQDDTLPVELSRSLADALRGLGAPVTYAEFPEAQHWNVPRQPAFTTTLDPFFQSLKPENQPR